MLRSILPATALLLMTTLVYGADNNVAPPSNGATLYGQFCGTCHDHPKDRIPARSAIAQRSPDEIMQSLTIGVMRANAAGLNNNDRMAIATFLTGKMPTGKAVLAAEKNLCTNRQVEAISSGPQWNGWGRDLDNSRFQPETTLTAANVSRLKVKWSFGYPGTYTYGQPTVVGGRVYVTSVMGRVYSLDAKTGCVHWIFDAPAPSRTAMTVAQIPTPSGPRVAVIFGDDSAHVYALDVTTGGLIWSRRLDEHPDARISGAPVFHQDRLYVPVSSLEELSAPAPKYECCKFRGSLAALDTRDGKVLWQTYTIDEKAKPYRKSKQGTQLYGPAGGSIWSAPTLDPKHNLIYVGTGNSYTDKPAPRTDSIVAFDMTTGAIRWVNQVHPEDNYIVGCDSPETAGQGNCPEKIGPDVDFGTSPILRTLSDGRRVLLTGQKSGQVYGLDPATGKELWTARVGAGSVLGGIEWGTAADTNQFYVAISDIAATTGKPGGLTALRIQDGKQVWRTPPPPAVCSWGTRSCNAAQSQAVSVIPGVVFSGSHDGHLRAYAATDGRILWDFDTAAQPYATVNSVPGVGGSLDHGGPAIAGGMLFVNSGYGRINGQPGNVLLAFGTDP